MARILKKSMKDPIKLFQSLPSTLFSYTGISIDTTDGFNLRSFKSRLSGHGSYSGVFYRAGAYLYLDTIVDFSILTTDNCIF